MWLKVRTSVVSLSRKHVVFSSTGTNDDRYIQSSKLPTMHFQPGLFRLPIPKLEATCERYLAALKPVVSTDDAFAKTLKLVEDFKRKDGGIGQGKMFIYTSLLLLLHVLVHTELQVKMILNDRQNRHTSYISELWFDMYLSDRKSLVLNYNPFIAFKEDPSTSDQVAMLKV